MKTSVKNAIEDIYSLFKKPPKQTNKSIKNVKQHQLDFADKPEHFFTADWTNSKNETNTHNLKITKLKSAINKVIQSKRCVWCKEEYQISALCGHCQDEVFIGAPDLREEVK